MNLAAYPGYSRINFDYIYSFSAIAERGGRIITGSASQNKNRLNWLLTQQIREIIVAIV
jgi:hypothetical protein